MKIRRYLARVSWLKWLVPWVLVWLVIVAWPEWKKTREVAKLRAEACEIMQARGFVQAEAGAVCTKDNDVYLAGIDAAVESQTARLVDKVDQELDQLTRANAREDPETFDRITFDQLLDDYLSPIEVLADAPDRLPERVVINVPWVMVTGYGQVRVEHPARTKQAAALLSLDPLLLDIIATETVAVICRRSDDPELQCGGTIYVRRASSDISGYRVVRLEFDPISEAQIDASSQSLIRPQFTGPSSNSQGFYMQRFINAFGSDGPT